MNEIFKRLTNESPSFFKRIQAIAITLGLVGVAILKIPEDVVMLPPIIYQMAGYFIACGIVAGTVAGTTVKDPSILDKKKD